MTKLKKAKIFGCDLFCGAGGTSSGLALACRELGIDIDLLAVNHWQVAIDTHTASHPWARHMCASVDHINPRDVVPGGRLQILCASPECTGHSIARGGRPVNDQGRATAWHILKWAQELYIDNILIENVREFRDWGPVGVNNKPLKSRRGETFKAFIEALKSLGYRVDHRILNAADYGDPTTRERLFILARRRNKEICWPTPTHSRKGGPDLFGTTERYRAAREIIDWTIPNPSIFTRKKPLAPTTMARIIAGLTKFNPQLEPFIVTLRGGLKNMAAPRGVDEPVGTVSAQGTHLGLCEPFMVNMKGKSNARDIEIPLATQTTQIHQYLCEPFVLGQQSCSAPRDVNGPIPTVATAGAISLIEPFIVGHPRQKDGVNQTPLDSIDNPLRTVTATSCDFSLVEPFIVTPTHGDKGKNDSNHRVYSIDNPLGVVVTENRFALAEPFITKYYGTALANGVDEPLDTVTTKDRFGLVQPEWNGYRLDIRFRMLQPHELARAQGFPDNYKFQGTKSDKVKQIGNAVPVGLAKALITSLLADYRVKPKVQKIPVLLTVRAVACEGIA